MAKLKCNRAYVSINFALYVFLVFFCAFSLSVSLSLSLSLSLMCSFSIKADGLYQSEELHCRIGLQRGCECFFRRQGERRKRRRRKEQDNFSRGQGQHDDSGVQRVSLVQDGERGHGRKLP